MNDSHHNHYDKYFEDERVKHLFKKFIYLLNPPMVKNPIMTERYIINDNLNNTITNINPNINIITNSSIHNNIVIINSIPNKKSDNEFNLNQSLILKKTPLKISMKGNVKQKKEFEKYNIDDDEIDFNEDEYDNYNCNYNYNFNKGNNIIIKYGRNDSSNIYHNKINSTFASKANNLLSKSQYSLCRIKSNNNKYNNHKMVTIRQSDKRQNETINSYNLNNSTNSLSYLKSFPKKKYEKKSAESKKNLFIYKSNNKNKAFFKEESLSTDIQTPNQINNCNGNGKKKRIITANKNSVDFRLVSGVPKEKLVKISRNLSQKTLKDE